MNYKPRDQAEEDARAGGMALQEAGAPLDGAAADPRASSVVALKDNAGLRLLRGARRRAPRGGAARPAPDRVVRGRSSRLRPWATDGALRGRAVGVVAHFHCGVADAACARCESAPSSRLAAARGSFRIMRGERRRIGTRAAGRSSRRRGARAGRPPRARDRRRPAARPCAASPRRRRRPPPRRAAGPAGEADAGGDGGLPYQGQRASMPSRGRRHRRRGKKAVGRPVRGRDPATAGEFPSNWR